MADIWSRNKRSEVMSKIRGKDTKPEIAVRKLLHQMGYRFTVNGPKNRLLPGKPDIVLPRFKTVVFVHGCFWHRHKGCRIASNPKSNQQFWEEKFAKNVARDRKVQRQLRKLGWHSIIVWECAVGKPEKVCKRLKRLIDSQMSSPLK
ncbi:MAG: very short patch repair endonuclease [Puniceicoccaceae bacterium]